MLPRQLPLLALSALLLLPLARARATTRAVPPLPAAQQEWIAVLPVRTEDEMQRLARVADLRGRYDDMALALGDAGTLAFLQSLHPKSFVLAPELPGEALYVIALQDGEQIDVRPGVRLLHQDARRAIVGIAPGAGLDAHELVPHRTSAAFHDGIAPVPARRQSPARTVGSHHRRGLAPPNPDPRVQALVNGVLQANLDADVQFLSNNFHTRRSDQPGGVQAQDYLKQRYEALSLATTLFSFNGDADDVIAELPGLLEPDKIVIVGAHYDSINNNGAGARAPGADDNASGTAAVLELARLMSTTPTRFRYTIRFCSFASEEFGDVGSAAYSADLVAHGVQVVAMLNTDMNAYRAPGDALDLDMCTTDTTPWLTDDLIALSQLYVPTLPVVKGPLFGGTSDHRSFYQDGYPAAFYFEDLGSYSPYIHSSNDTYGTSANDFTLAELIVQSVMAGLASYADPVDLVIDHTALADSEDSWNPYVAKAAITSLVGSTPLSAELHWDNGGGEVVAVMHRDGTANEWAGQIPAQAPGTDVAYWLVAFDDQGFSEQLPRTGTFSFQVGRKERFYFDDFEAGAGGWSHGGRQDDFELGTPAGLSTDPSAAFSGASCFGNDLGMPGFNGEYRPDTNCFLVSPSIDATGRGNVHLRYARWIGVEDATHDQAELRVAGTPFWSNPAGSGADNTIDTTWVLHHLDVTSVAAGNPGFTVRFKMTSDGGLQYGGWNIDDVELYSVAPGTKAELTHDSALLSLTDGGAVGLQLDLGSANGGRGYLLFASVSGTAPGFDFGPTHVPLNFDAVTAFFLRFVPLLPGFVGTTDAAGLASATFAIPAGQAPAFAGTTLWFAAATLGPSDLATNPVEVLFTE